MSSPIKLTPLEATYLAYVDDQGIEPRAPFCSARVVRCVPPLGTIVYWNGWPRLTDAGRQALAAHNGSLVGPNSS